MDGPLIHKQETPSLAVSIPKAVSHVNVPLDSQVIMALIAWILMNVNRIFVMLILNQLHAKILKEAGNVNVLMVILLLLIREGIQVFLFFL